MFRGKVNKIHFIGIGGIGMSGIAEVLLTLKYKVSGSDLKSSKITQRLEGLGALVFNEHVAKNIDGVDVVVVSSAIPKDNPEIQYANENKIPVIKRAEMLAELMRLKYGIAVAGSHGKTTTTSILASLLAEGGMDPTMVIGGQLKSIGTNAKLGTGEYFVAEADESDGSFLNLIPTLAVITNIDPEHLDHWKGGIEEIEQAFIDFANKVPFYGVLAACIDHPRVQRLIPKFEKRVVTYGLNKQAEIHADNIICKEGITYFKCYQKGAYLEEFGVRLFGEHNVQNTLAAIAIALEVGLSKEHIKNGLLNFQGIGRRFEIKGTKNNVLVVDDYGHHPAEVLATLKTAKQNFDRRIVVAFQPHRFTRTRDLFDDFVCSFNDCDKLYITNIYAASEKPIEHISGASLAKAIQKTGHRNVEYAGNLDELMEKLIEECRPGDLLLSLGAGNIGSICDEYLKNS